MAEIKIDPANRIEGHQKWDVTVSADTEGTVTESHIGGMMFRGFENIMKGRDPRDAIVICQRI
jgi:hydrogenase large subunit